MEPRAAVASAAIQPPSIVSLGGLAEGAGSDDLHSVAQLLSTRASSSTSTISQHQRQGSPSRCTLTVSRSSRGMSIRVPLQHPGSYARVRHRSAADSERCALAHRELLDPLL